MRISDWSSDVCSSDLPPIIGAAMRLMTSEPAPVPIRIGNSPARMTATVIALGRTRSKAPSRMASSTDRKSVVEGKSGSVRVDIGGRRSIKKKTQRKKKQRHKDRQHNNKNQ